MRGPGRLDEPVAVGGHGPGEVAKDERQVADDVAAVEAERPQPEPVERVEMDQAVLERRGIEGVISMPRRPIDSGPVQSR
jgi:hypothetical protein